MSTDPEVKGNAAWVLGMLGDSAEIGDLPIHQLAERPLRLQLENAFHECVPGVRVTPARSRLEIQWAVTRSLDELIEAPRIPGVVPHRIVVSGELAVVEDAGCVA